MALDETDLLSGYNRRRSPVPRANLDTALSPYRLSVRQLQTAPLRGMSDLGIRRLSAKAVVRRALLRRANKSIPTNYLSMSGVEFSAFLRRP